MESTFAQIIVQSCSISAGIVSRNSNSIQPSNFGSNSNSLSSSHYPALPSGAQQLPISSSQYAPKGVGGGASNGPSTRSSELTKIVVAQLAVLVTTIREDNWDSTVLQIRQVRIFFFV